jgi:hypothetical protein
MEGRVGMERRSVSSSVAGKKKKIWRCADSALAQPLAHPRGALSRTVKQAQWPPSVQCGDVSLLHCRDNRVDRLHLLRTLQKGYCGHKMTGQHFKWTELSVQLSVRSPSTPLYI